MKLPNEFIERMNKYFEMFGNEKETEEFFASFDAMPKKGLRFNRLKVEVSDDEEVLKRLGVSDIKSVDWCESGYYIDFESAGKDPYYHSGVYYPQEPSAMLPAQVMAAKPGDIVLDMCAAPGGKACRLAEDLKGEGLLVANEINADRAKALLRNVERMGIDNCVILNETPENIAKHLPSFFDKILIDAPCSGEGMFRRDSQAVGSWQKFGPTSCVPIQKDILEASYDLLKTGGEIVYSTCTFCEDENERQIVSFLERHPDIKVISHIDDILGVTHEGDGDLLPGAMRIWPHLSEGDGHFCVHLKKILPSDDNVVEKKDITFSVPYRLRKRGDNYSFNKSREVYLEFCKEILTDLSFKKQKNKVSNGFVMHNNKIHILPIGEYVFDGLKVVKLGFYPGEIKPTTMKRLFIPSHSMALTLAAKDIKDECLVSFKREDDRVWRYLKGETVTLGDDERKNKNKSGYVLIAVDDFILGFGKISKDGSIKNMYPKAWRLS